MQINILKRLLHSRIGLRLVSELRSSGLVFPNRRNYSAAVVLPRKGPKHIALKGLSTQQSTVGDAILYGIDVVANVDRSVVADLADKNGGTKPNDEKRNTQQSTNNHKKTSNRDKRSSPKQQNAASILSAHNQKKNNHNSSSLHKNGHIFGASEQEERYKSYALISPRPNANPSVSIEAAATMVSSHMPLRTVQCEAVATTHTAPSITTTSNTTKTAVVVVPPERSLHDALYTDICSNPAAIRTIYTGQRKDDKAHGIGTMTFPNGKTLTGLFQHNRISDGSGYQKYANGDVFVGTWVEGKWQGRGTLTNANNQTLKAEFKSGMIVSGQGVYVYSSGVVYEGTWVKGLWEGPGKAVYPDGSIAQGEFRQGELCAGSVTHKALSDHSIYTGTIHSGRVEGSGRRIYSNGDYQEGTFIDGNFVSGIVQMTLHNKSVYKGGYTDGDWHGQGTLTDVTGKSVSGIFKKGLFMGSSEPTVKSVSAVNTSATTVTVSTTKPSTPVISIQNNDGAASPTSNSTSDMYKRDFVASRQLVVSEVSASSKTSSRPIQRILAADVDIPATDISPPSISTTDFSAVSVPAAPVHLPAVVLSAPITPSETATLVDASTGLTNPSRAGTLTLPDGSVYNGALLNGTTMHGPGVLIQPTGHCQTGEFREGGLYNGTGSIQLPDGGVFEGTWLCGSWDRGTFSKNGTSVTGEFKNNKFHHGEGYMYLNKRGEAVFEGSWRQGNWHKGTVTMRRKKLVYEGEFRNRRLYNGAVYTTTTTGDMMKEEVVESVHTPVAPGVVIFREKASTEGITRAVPLVADTIDTHAGGIHATDTESDADICGTSVHTIPVTILTTRTISAPTPATTTDTINATTTTANTTDTTNTTTEAPTTYNTPTNTTTIATTDTTTTHPVNHAVISRTFSGSSTQLLPDGSTYSGTFVKGKRQGFGTLTSPHGQVCSGHFKNGRLYNGSGVRVLPTGDTFEGDWVQGKWTGLGKLTYQSGETLVGEFRDDRIYNGAGTVLLPSDKSYTGTIVDGVLGFGTILFPDGNTLSGEFRNGSIYHGNGTQVYSTGDTYSGSWQNGVPHGEGCFTCTTESGVETLEGVFVEGNLFNGTASKLLNNGVVYKEVFSEGQPALSY